MKISRCEQMLSTESANQTRTVVFLPRFQEPDSTRMQCQLNTHVAPECSLTESRIIWCVEKETSDVMPRDDRWSSGAPENRDVTRSTIESTARVTVATCKPTKRKIKIQYIFFIEHSLAMTHRLRDLMSDVIVPLATWESMLHPL